MSISGWFQALREGRRHTVQSALEGAGLADFSDIGPTLELHDELKCLESEAVHLTATVRAALAHARRHAIDVARSLCPPHTTASTGRTPPVDSPIGVALKAAVDDFSTRVHREVIRFSQGAATPASVSGMSTAGSVVPGAVFSGLQAASQCAEVATGRVEELKLTRLDFDAHRRKAAAAQAKVDAARAKGEGAGMTERQARHLEKLQEHLLRRKQKLAEVGEHFDRLEDDLVREMESSKAAVVPMLQQAPHNFLQLQAAFYSKIADVAVEFTQGGGWAETPPIADTPQPDFSPRRPAYSDVDPRDLQARDEEYVSDYEDAAVTGGGGTITPPASAKGAEDADVAEENHTSGGDSPEYTPEKAKTNDTPIGTPGGSTSPSPHSWQQVSPEKWEPSTPGNKAHLEELPDDYNQN